MRPGWLLGLLVLGLSCASEKKRAPEPPSARPAQSDPSLGPVFAEGLASRYSDRLAGRKTASGARYDPAKKTCAHLKLPFGTWVQIERVRTGQTARCVVNDRGPYSDRKIIDLSRSVAESLGFTGVAKVRLRKVLR